MTMKGRVTDSDFWFPPTILFLGNYSYFQLKNKISKNLQ